MSMRGLKLVMKMLCLATLSTFWLCAMENPPGMAWLTHDLTWPMSWLR